MERKIKNYLSVFAISMSAFLLDFLSKYKIISIFKSGDTEKIYVNQFLDFVLVFNSGISYGLFSGGGNLQRWILIILSLFVIIFLLNFLKNENSIISRTSVSLIIGGALGNIYDRFVYGAVVDFISLHVKGFSWYIFNIADIFIVLGVIMFILSQTIKSSSNLEIKNE